jgi:hypothetical protein
MLGRVGAKTRFVSTLPPPVQGLYTPTRMFKRRSIHLVLPRKPLCRVIWHLDFFVVDVHVPGRCFIRIDAKPGADSR